MSEGYEKINNRKESVTLPVMRSLKFWARNVAESVGLTVLAALVLDLFMMIQIDGGFLAAVKQLLPVFGYYILMAGSFVLMIYVVNVFQIYYSLLVSMNVTRKATAIGIVGSTGALVLCVNIMMWLIWKMTPGEISEKSIDMFPLFAGILFALTGIMLLFGIVITRWGRIGAIILTVIAAVGGGCVGACVVIVDKDVLQSVLGLANMDFRIVTVIGIVIYIAAGVFTEAATRKLEVRR